jgi:hypothetical protein
MATPANRAKIQLVRGTYANIAASIADLVDGELCYAKDQNKLYMVEGDALTPLDYLGLGDVDEAVQDVIGSSLSGGTGLTLTYDDDANTLVIDLDDTAVTTGQYGSSTAIPVITIDQQGRITAAETASISTDLTIGDGTATDTVSLGTDTLTFTGGTGLTSAVTDNTVTFSLGNTAVTVGTYGSSTTIPVITVDQQGRITAAETASISTDLSIATDGSGTGTISLATDTLTIAGGTGLTTSITDDTVTVSLDDTSVTTGSYGSATEVATFTVDEQGRLTAAGNTSISLTHSEVTDFDTAVRETTGIDQTFEPMGHAVRTDSVISFDSGTQIFTIQPVATSYDVWCKGIKYTKTEAESITLPSTTGLYYIYFDPSGVLSYRNSYFDWQNDTPTAYVYWNQTTGTAPYVADERHGITLDWATHEYLHRTRGAVIANGFSISNFTEVGDGSIDAHAQIDLSGGTFFDEDLEVQITHNNTPAANGWEQDLQGPARIPAFYISGTAWVKDSATDFPLKQGSSYPVFNSYNGTSWALTEASANRYIVSFVIATNNINEPVICVLGQAEYSNVGDAEGVQFNDLALGGFPSVEFRPLYKVVFQVGNYANSVNARISSVIDIRQLSSAGVGQGIGSDHGILSGLGDDDHLQYLHLTNNRTGVTANISTSGTLKTTNTTESTSSSTGALVVAGGAGIGGDLFVEGNLTIKGDSTTIETETIVVEDANIQLGTVEAPSDTTANGGGISLLGDTTKTFSWASATAAWTSSENIDLATDKEYKIGTNTVLTGTGLGGNVVSSSLTSVGTITTGTWNGTAIAYGYGGTGYTTYSDGQLLIGKTNGSLARATLTAGTNVSIQNGDGSITVSSTDTTYSAGDGLDLSTTIFSLDLKANGGLVIESTELALDLAATSITGTLAVGDGGTGLASIAQGSVLVANTDDTLSALDGGGTVDGILVYDAATDAVSWATEIDGGIY